MTARTTLYQFVPMDRSGRVAWLLHELGRPFDVLTLDHSKGESQEEDFLRLSPVGKVPCLVEDEAVLFESGASLEFLADRYGEGRFAPAADSPERATYLSWLYFASATLDPVCIEFVMRYPDEEEARVRRKAAEREIGRYLRALDLQLGGRDTMLPFGFTPVDIQVAASLHYADRAGALGGHDPLVHYLGRMRQRPAAVTAGLFAS